MAYFTTKLPFLEGIRSDKSGSDLPVSVVNNALYYLASMKGNLAEMPPQQRPDISITLPPPSPACEQTAVSILSSLSSTPLSRTVFDPQQRNRLPLPNIVGHNASHGIRNTHHNSRELEVFRVDTADGWRETVRSKGRTDNKSSSVKTVKADDVHYPYARCACKQCKTADAGTKRAAKRAEMKERNKFANKGKRCMQCRTDDTHQWRRGPDGEKSLCNACGLRFLRKLKREAQVTASSTGNDISKILNS